MSETNTQTRIIHQLIIQELEHPEGSIVPALLDYVNSTADPHTELLVIACGAVFQHADYMRALHGTEGALDVSRRALEIIDLEDTLEQDMQ